MVHNYLVSNSNKIQARIRKRGQSSEYFAVEKLKLFKQNRKLIDVKYIYR